MTISVVIPVKNGEQYLDEVLKSVEAQAIDAQVQTIVVDSGSSDRSLEIARAHGAHVIAIPPEEFGHGRTRNMAAEKARGEYIAFLTQDATPATGTWLASMINGFSLGEKIGAVYGPHLPRKEASPMIANELETFFAEMTPNGGPVIQSADGDANYERNTFFSNVNSCIKRSCWDEIRFRDVPYSEDQAFGNDLLEAKWRKVYQPEAAVYHSHHYSTVEFARRYFDEYRGLRDVSGHVEPFQIRDVLGTAKRQVAADRDYLRRRNVKGIRLAGWTARSGIHHLSRRVFSALGSRSQKLPAQLRTALSLEGRADGAGAIDTSIAPPSTRHVSPSTPTTAYDFVRKALTVDEQPLVPPLTPERIARPLHFAWLIPPFLRGSGGHMTIFNVIHNLEQLGHSCSIWLHDPHGQQGEGAAASRHAIVEHFRPLKAAVFNDFSDWFGADIAMATGWQTAYRVRGLKHCALRTYFVQDHEPDFYPQSAERIWAEATYTLGMPCIAASQWLADIQRERYGGVAHHFQLGVDFEHYKPRPLERDDDTVVFYARTVTPRRGVEIGLLALEEVVTRRPDTRVVLFGWHRPPETAFPFDFLGIATPDELARLYCSATVGLSISLTNYSLIPQEMMACGLPVVEVEGFSAEQVFGPGGRVLELARPDPTSLADALIGLLESPAHREELSQSGLEFVEGHTWKAATEQILEAVRTELTRRYDEAHVGQDKQGANPRVQQAGPSTS